MDAVGEWVERLAAAGFEPRRLRAPTGEIVVTVHGARILGAWSAASRENLYWVNPALNGTSAAAAAFRRGTDWNLGGDRAWLAPEIELHFLNPARPSAAEYGVARTIDPGQFAVTEERANRIVLQTRGVVRNTLSGMSFTLVLRREIELCDLPSAAAGLPGVGYTIRSELHIEQPDRPDAVYGLWHLIQVPIGGVVHVPVRPSAVGVDYFQSNVAAHIRQDAQQFTFPVTGTAVHKLGLRAADVVGQFGYFRADDAGSAQLIVRDIHVPASAVYADYPGHDRRRRDIAVQVYNDAGAIGRFGEMEYHAPAATAATAWSAHDLCRTYCLAGPADRVRAAGAALLHVPV